MVEDSKQEHSKEHKTGMNCPQCGAFIKTSIVSIMSPTYFD